MYLLRIMKIAAKTLCAHTVGALLGIFVGSGGVLEEKKWLNDRIGWWNGEIWILRRMAGILGAKEGKEVMREIFREKNKVSFFIPNVSILHFIYTNGF